MPLQIPARFLTINNQITKEMVLKITHRLDFYVGFL